MATAGGRTSPTLQPRRAAPRTGWQPNVPRQYASASADADLPDYMRSLDAPAVADEWETPDVPDKASGAKLLSRFKTTAKTTLKATLMAKEAKEREDQKQQLKAKRRQGSKKNATELDNSGQLEARFVLRSSLGAVYEDEVRYTGITVPDNSLLYLDGRGEILIPDGEVQIDLIEPKMKQTVMAAVLLASEFSCGCGGTCAPMTTQFGALPSARSKTHQKC